MTTSVAKITELPSLFRHPRDAKVRPEVQCVRKFLPLILLVRLPPRHHVGDKENRSVGRAGYQELQASD